MPPDKVAQPNYWHALRLLSEDLPPEERARLAGWLLNGVTADHNNLLHFAQRLSASNARALASYLAPLFGWLPPQDWQ